MVIYILECPECGDHLKVSIGQAIYSDKLSWFRSCRCEQCGFSTEEDGFERDVELRNKILQSEGEFLLLVDNPENRSHALVESRQMLDITMSEVLQFRQIDSSCIASGTLVEMNWLCKRLKNNEIESHIISKEKSE